MTDLNSENNINVAALLQLLQQLQNGGHSSSSAVSSSSNNINLQFDAFNENDETFSIYKQRLENFLRMRGVTNDERKVQVLINCIGTKHYQLLSSLTAPDLPNTKDYDALTKLLENYLCPKPNEVTEQHTFLLRMQHEGESISTYFTELKRLSVSCKFICESCGENTADTHLRSQFIRGVRDADIRQRLLEVSDPKLNDILKTALAVEASKIQSRTMQDVRQINTNSTFKNNNFTHQNKITSRKTNNGNHFNNKTIQCFRCDTKGHKANECKSKEKLFCDFCKQKGHISKVCIKAKQQMKIRDGKIKSTNSITIENQHDRCGDVKSSQLQNDNSTFEYYDINALQLQTNSIDRGKFMIQVKINKKPIIMEFDTGSAISTIGQKR